MKILVIGGSGLIGSHLIKQGQAMGHNVLGTCRKHPSPGLAPLDCADFSAMERLLDLQQPEAVVHAAGWTWVDGCEDDPKRAFAENAEQPAELAKLCQARGIRFSWFSSSYVFDGNAGPYSESAVPNPINVYGHSKLEGERRIQSACGDAGLIARVICVYGAEAQRKNFACQVLTALQEGQTLTLPSDQCGNPTWARDISRWLITLLDKRQGGVWHLGGPWPECTRPEWAERLVAGFKSTGVHEHPDFSVKTILTSELKQKALRPLQAGIISEREWPMDSIPTEFSETLGEMV